MNIPEILTIISPALKPYLGKAMEGMSSEAGKSLWSAIKNLFHEPAEQQAVLSLENPESEETRQDEFLKMLAIKLADSPHLVEQLKNSIATGDQVINVQQYGEKSVSMRDNYGNINF